MDSHDYGSTGPAKSYNHPKFGSSDDDTIAAHKENPQYYPHDEFEHHKNKPDINNPNLHRTDTVDTYQTYDEGGGTVDNRQEVDQAKIDYEHHKHLWWYRVRYVMSDPFSEFCGTMIMIVFGDGSVAQVLLSANATLPVASQDKGNYQSISWGWGIGVMLGVYVCAKSGGHL